MEILFPIYRRHISARDCCIIPRLVKKPLDEPFHAAHNEFRHIYRFENGGYMNHNTNSVDERSVTAPELPDEADYSELTLANDFMFSKVMQDKELCKEFLRRVLPELQIEHVKDIVAQKYMKHYFGNKGVRLDVYVMDDTGARYDVEMQLTNKHNLPKRSRYYSSMMDANELLKGENYDKLSDSYVIFVCTFDPFENGMHRYTFRNICLEDRNVFLKDGATRIFLNTKGTAGDVSPKLLSFLNYLDGKLEPADDKYLEALDTAVKNARKNEDWRSEYMTYKDIKRGSYLHGFADGEEKGIAIGEAKGVAKGKEEAATKVDEVMLNLVSSGELPESVAEKIRHSLKDEE